MIWSSDVFSEMERLRREMNNLFTQSGYNGKTQYPPFNVYANKDTIMVTAELPGLSKDGVSIQYAEGVLTVSGKNEAGAPPAGMSVVRRERMRGDFERSIQIPVKIDAEKISAVFNNGILSITLPKAEEAKPKTITIETK